MCLPLSFGEGEVKDAPASGAAIASATSAAISAAANRAVLWVVVMGALLERPTAGCDRLPDGGPVR